MPVTLRSIDDCERILGTLNDNSPISIDDLLEILLETSAATPLLIARLAIVEHALRDRPFIDGALEAASWVLGILGFSFGCADYYESGHQLSSWGWAGLLTGPLALTLAAWGWQRREWQEYELIEERNEIGRMRQLLTEIELEANRRVAIV
jgi:hypothetical protein